MTCLVVWASAALVFFLRGAWVVGFGTTRARDLVPRDLGHYEDFAIDRRAQKISSTESFQSEIEYTPKTRDRLRRHADRACVICQGGGLHLASRGWQICSCVIATLEDK